MAQISDITVYSALSRRKIAHGSVNNELWQQIKTFNNVSKRNPQKISFIPINTTIILEFFDDLICSPHGTEFLVIYHQIPINEYKLMYCKSYHNICPNYRYYDDNPFIPETCDCSCCEVSEKRKNACHQKELRLSL